jgi:antitoxin (DNA-binding transcriptional repressor) of toxin-antitoxin stability system
VGFSGTCFCVVCGINLTYNDETVQNPSLFYEEGSEMQVSMQEFKSHLSQYVVRAQSGQLIELTSYRKVVARVVGVPTVNNVGVEKLLMSGVASWQGGKPCGAAFKLESVGKSVTDIVLEDRG